ncbi:hypothetical protein INT47_000462 [Mucor saturninus]|uniref:Chromo domain-containing protein n=1 Tax=Mucor saturninus TaxID=64648 RepID=A0A8H7UYN3_9FUNG|nr:hypothetical protein INT47_000462 [Mucor saturninus]
MKLITYVKNKSRKNQKVYPNIATSIMKSVLLPVVPRSIREEYVRPDTIRIFVPPEEDYESDVEQKLESERKAVKDKYKKKTIKKVVGKIKNETGQVTYKIIWSGHRHNDVELVPSKGLQDHPDWALVEAFEYYTAKNQRNGINSSDMI